MNTRAPRKAFDESMASTLYALGKNDTQIATELKCRWQDVQKWRVRNDLPSNVKRKWKYIKR